VGQHAHWNRSLVGRHPAEGAAGNQRRSRAEIRRAKRGGRSRGTGADHDDVDVVRAHSSLVPNI
jgi:hypothetical protein